MPEKIPVGWVETTLGEVCLGVDTIRPEDSPKTEFTYFDIGGIDNKTNRIIEAKTVLGRKASSRARQVIKKDDILFSTVRTYLKNVAQLEHEYSNPVGSTGFAVIRAAEGVLPKFLFHQVLSDAFLLPLNELQSGSSYPAVRDSDVFSQPILLPPTKEQERIVAKLGTSFARLAAGEKAALRGLKRIKRYKDSVLHAAVTGELTRDWRETNEPEETGEQLLERLLRERRARWEEAELKRLTEAGKPPKDDKWKERYPEPVKHNENELGDLPSNWAWANVEQIASIGSGNTPYGIKRHDGKKNGDVLWIKVGDLNADGNETWIRSGKTTFSEETALSYGLTIFPEGTIVFPKRGGAIATDKKRRLSERSCLDANLMGLTCHKDIPAFFWIWFQSVDLESLSGGSSVPQINNYDVLLLNVSLPPLIEQTEIVRQVEQRFVAADKFAAKLNSQLEHSRDTRQTLLREAFSGQLGTQDPNDEPASVLLERIQVLRQEGAEAQKKTAQERRKNRPKKTGDTMNKTVPTVDVLRDAWQKIGQEANARLLFDEAGFKADQVVLFYELLQQTPEIHKAFAEKVEDTSPAPLIHNDTISAEPTPVGRFRLVSLWLEDFKNLKDYQVHFQPGKGFDVVLGWNGTGKSNLFESLVIIFRDLHNWLNKKSNPWPKEPMNGYRLVYEIEEQVLEVSWQPTEMKRPTIRLAPLPQEEKSEPDFKMGKRQNLLLPRFVFGYYSGPTNRLAEHFWPMQRDHYDRLRLADSDDPETLARIIEQRRFFCAETHHAKYVLLAFAYKKDPKISYFLEERLRILGFESALFVIRKPRWARSGSKPSNFWDATGIMLRVMEKLRRFSVAPLIVEQMVNDGYRSKREDHYYFFIPDLKTLHAFAAEYADARSFFTALESTDFSELIHDVKIQVRVKAAENAEIPITFHELSEGEQQLLMVLGLMRFTKSHQSLVLLDEPDTHLNPHWSVNYLKDLASVVSDNDEPSPEQETSQSLMATHDPLVIASLLKDQIHLLKRDPDSLECYWQLATENPRGLGYTGILTSEMFGFRSDLDPETLADLDNRVRLIARVETLSEAEKKEIAEIDTRLAEAGFSKAFSDPYYAAFVRAWGKDTPI